MVRDEKNIVIGAIEAALARAGIRRGASILIGLSGGADSVALTCALLELRERLGFRIAAAHLNHRIRGDESDRDEAFVRAMCARLGVELIVEHAEGLDASISSANLEERAREVRRDFLGRVADRVGAGYVALGHHRDDQAETAHQAHQHGLGLVVPMVPERGPGRLIRPMLSVSRAEIRGYLDARATAFVEDSTNSSRDILRNRIRAELLPMLEREYAPGLGGRLVEVAAEMRSLDDLVAAIAARELDAMRVRGGALDVSGFSGVSRAVQPVAIRLFLSERMGSLRRISRAHIEAMRQLILAGGPSDSIDLPGGWRAEREYNFFQLIEAGAERKGSGAGAGFSVAIAAKGITVVEEAGFAFEASTNPATHASMPDSLFSFSLVAMFDAAKIAEAGLVARNF